MNMSVQLETFLSATVP